MEGFSKCLRMDEEEDRIGGRLRGRVVKFVHSAAVAQGSDPGPQTWHHSSGHVEAASHIPQLEGPATKIYNYVLEEEGWGGFGK